MTFDLPHISVIIPTLNEEQFIGSCLRSLYAGNYPKDCLDIIVVDGGSSDATLEQVAIHQQQHSRIRVLENPKKIVPTAVNLGIEAADTEIIVWVGAHALYDADYLTKSVSILISEKCASVGGVIQAVGISPMGKAIAAATSSKFGIGNAKYRYASSRQSVDTVFGGCWFKRDIIAIGGFSEQWARNQDYELNMRLRQQIGDIILDPSIRCQYFCRESLPALARQYFDYGYWRFHTFMKYPQSLGWRQLAPLALLIGLFGSAAILPFSPSIAVVLPAIYLIATIIAAMFVSIQHKRIEYIVKLPAIFATLHLSWALGFVNAIWRRSIKTLSTILQGS